jgi:hypothetical protein
MGIRPAYRGEKPLKYPKEERYAQERAYGYRMRESARRAGLDDYTGIQTKYEYKPRVQARIDFLKQADLTNEFHQAKRRHLEERLELVAFGSMFEYVIIGPDGKPRLDWKRLAESDLDVTVAELRFDKETGNVVHMARDSALNAISQLREMRGFKAADRHHVEITQIDQLTDAELARIAAGGIKSDFVTTIETQALPPPRDNEDDEEIRP